MTDERLLRPCPFCGAGAEWLTTWADDDSGTAHVWCKNCGAEGPAAADESEALRLWDVRSDSDPLAPERHAKNAPPGKPQET